MEKRRLTQQDILFIDAGIGVVVAFQTDPNMLIIKPVRRIKYKGVIYKIDMTKILERVEYQKGIGILVQLPGDRAIIL